MPNPLDQDEIAEERLTIGQAAQRVGLSVSTLLRYEKAGRINPERTPTGHRRYRASEVDNLLKAAS